MQNLKIQLDNDEQIEEIDNIAGQVGLNIIGIEIEKKPDGLKWVFLSKNKTHNGKPSKEITLPELREMANPMKEYLEKQPDGTYSLVLRGDLCKESDILIPEGADKYAYFNEYDNANFYKGDFDAVWQDNGYWDHDMDDYKSYCKKFGVVLWQRATHPEELPFIDDEPKYTDDEVKYMDENGQGRLQLINDQYAEIEKVRQHNHYFKDVSGLNEIDVYMVLKLFNVTDPCLQHIAKKALCAGQRGHKDFKKDLQDILDTAKRAVEIDNG